MRYMFLIHNDESHPEPGGAGWDELMGQYAAFGESLQNAGLTFTGEPLTPPTTATTVRLMNGKAMLTDGPFAETKEWMSGYYIVDCPDLDDALKIAARVPSAAFGSVEVRPIMEM